MTTSQPGDRFPGRTAGVVAAVLGAVVAGAVLAACSSSTTASTTTSTAASASTTTTAAAGSTTTSVPASGVSNLPVTDAVRADLVAARAAQLGIAPSTFTGLTPGDTYYAYDHTTGTYWAAGQMAVPGTDAAPGTDLYKAQVASQDNGSYLLFIQPSGGQWEAPTPVGASGPDTPCPLTVPAGVLQAWGWPAGSCRPAHY